MSKTIIDESEGYGFQLSTHSGGPQRGRCYQITVQDKYVVLDAWQMLQLFAKLAVRARDEGI